MSDKPEIHVQAFGGGVQSVALLHMAIEGKYRKPDIVIFADTQAEPQHVYEVVEHTKKVCLEHNIEFVIVTKGDLSDINANKTLDGKNYKIYIPAFARGKDTKKIGMMFRSCTEVFKIRPIRKFLRERGYKNNTIIKQWLGISTDEITRVKPSPLSWIDHVYPLIELDISRKDCIQYLTEKGLPAAKSACVFCPYRNYETWNHIRENESDWAKAVAYDESIRKTLPHIGDIFVHRSGIALKDAPIEKTSKVKNQLDLITLDSECNAGYCGL